MATKTVRPVVTSLFNKRQQLLNRKKQLTEDYEAAMAEIEEDLADLNTAIENVNKIMAPFTCKACGGTGTQRVCDAAGDMDDEPCSKCHGTGIFVEK